MKVACRAWLEVITSLSREFGGDAYVKGGGGNTSCKSAETLWVKPSGTTLAGLTPESFVALDRAAVSRLYVAEPPTEPSAREELVKNLMADAVHPDTPGRASVEAPLHDSLNARYVVHTHPAICNGLTCAIGGEAAVSRLFPEALWMPYVDPGYTLCMRVRQEIAQYESRYGKQPTIIFLQNHGIFVAGDTPEEIRETYARVMTCLQQAYDAVKVDDLVLEGVAPSEDEVSTLHAVLKKVFGREAAAVAVAGRFDVAEGPVSPDHIVYGKSYPFVGVMTEENLKAYQKVRGVVPRVIVTKNMVLGVGAQDTTARLALALARDGAVVKRLSHAFGGIVYLNDAGRHFIEDWEVESYRSQQV